MMSDASVSPPSVPNHSALSEMLSLVVDQRAKLQRFRDSSQLRWRTETSTKQRASLVTGPMHSTVHTSRRWNQEMQLIIEDAQPMEHVPAEYRRSTRINALLSEFKEEASRVTTRFVEEFHYDCSPNTPKQMSDESDDAAANLFWASPEDVADGLSLRISLIDDPVVAKRAKLEMRVQFRMLSQLLELFPTSPIPITVHPQVVSCYAGHYVIVSAMPGRVPSSPASLDCISSPELAVALEYIGESLNVTSYDMQDDEGNAVTRFGPPTASAFEGDDGRLYLETVLGFFPHFPAAQGAPITARHALFLRVEAVCAAPDPVSPGAFVSYGGRQSRRLREQTARCVRRLTMETIPRLAKELVTSPPCTVEDLLYRRMKPLGVNVALLGILLSHIHVVSAAVRRMVFTEMVTRSARAYLDAQVSAAAGVDEYVMTFQRCCAALCDEELRRSFFDAQLSQILISKFPGASALRIVELPLSLLDAQQLIRRLSSLCGIVFAPGVTSSGTSPFHFSVDRLTASCLNVSVEDALYAVGSTADSTDDANATTPPTPPALGLIPAAAHRPESNAQFQRGRLWSLSSKAANDATTSSSIKEVLKNMIADVLRYRATRSGQSSVGYAYDRILAGQCVGGFDPEEALVHLDAAIDVLKGGAVDRVTNTLAHALCARAALYTRLGRFDDAQRDLDLATTMIGSRTLMVGPSSLCQSCFMDETGASRRQSSSEAPQQRRMGASQLAGRGSGSTLLRSPRRQGAKAIGARIFSLLADCLESAGRFTDAEPALRNVLQILSSLLGERHPAVGTAWGALGFNLLHQGATRREEAEEALKRDLEISETSKGSGHPSIAETVGNLAILYDTMGRYEEAEVLHRRDLELTQRAAKPNDLDLATSRTNLGITLYNLKRYEEAESFLKQALEARITVLGPSDKNVAVSLTNLACVELAQFRAGGDDACLRNAESHAMAAVSIIDQTLSPEHRLLRPALEHLAAIYACKGDGASTERIRERLSRLEDADENQGSS